MNLSTLLAPWMVPEVDADVCDLQNDSREVNVGDVFLAYPGMAVDGRRFIHHVVRRGASAVLYDPLNFPEDVSLASTVPLIPFPELANNLAVLANRFYDISSHPLKITGVTGTNGKTTIAHQLAQAHLLLGTTSVYMGTLGQGEPGALKSLLNTTPDALHIQRCFYEYVSGGVEHVCMEVSSHALQQKRVDGIEFKQAIYTNLTQEHLDYHKTIEAYARAKATLFASSGLDVAIINQDDAYAGIMRDAVLPDTDILTYGLGEDCDVRATNVTVGMTGSHFDVTSPFGDFKCSLASLGLFNVYNGLAVIASLLHQGHTVKELEVVMPKLLGSPGRMEVVNKSPCVLVDYAHTPDALENALVTLKSLKKNAKLFVVFGCGGNRDAFKRPMMGRVAEEHADYVILTSDNPRTEDPHYILKEIRDGMRADSDVVVIENREEAIKHALSLAKPEDIILIAGKGHETYQEIGNGRFPFSDETVVRKYSMK
jgi:UDP-N-acetylmuramoyl-L-alanyl-D-glutamate--2,6-diaminopimelate ligase